MSHVQFLRRAAAYPIAGVGSLCPRTGSATDEWLMQAASGWLGRVGAGLLRRRVLRSHRTEAAVVHWTGDLSGDGGGSVRAGELSAKPVTGSII